MLAELIQYRRAVLLVGLVASLAGLLAMKWRDSVASAASAAVWQERAGVALGQVAAANAALAVTRDSLRHADTAVARADTVWRTHRVADTVRVPLDVASLSRDSLVALLHAVDAAHRSCVADGVALADACSAYRLRTAAALAADDSALAARDRLIAALGARPVVPASARRCGLGAAIGYGAQVSGGVVRVGPSVTGGLACRL